MPHTPNMSRAKHKQLIADIIAAEADWTGIGERHNLTPERLSHWAQQDQNQLTLRGLCVLADLQTQILLSRCRLVAATRLLSLASGNEDGATPEISRKACVDLLRMDLRSTESELSDQGSADEAVSAMGQELRKALYGNDS